MSYMKNLYLELLESAVWYYENGYSAHEFATDNGLTELSLIFQVWEDAQELAEG